MLACDAPKVVLVGFGQVIGARSQAIIKMLDRIVWATVQGRQVSDTPALALVLAFTPQIDASYQ